MSFPISAALLDAIVLSVVAQEPEGTYGYKITQQVTHTPVSYTHLFLAAALDVKGKDGCAAVGEILLVQGVIRVIRQRGICLLYTSRCV